MKQLIFLLLFPCLAMAQYQGNSGQKITLGEQTTADGLIFRGVASIDTVSTTSKITRANKQDTSAYLLLDTVTNLLWHYKIGSNAWTQAGGGGGVTSFSAGTTGLTPSSTTTGAVTLGGTLAVANGGTGATTLAAAGIVTGSGTVSRIPRYTGTTTVGLSEYYDAGNGFLGIRRAPISNVELAINTGNNTNLYLSSTVLSAGDTVAVFEGINGTGTRNRSFGFYGGNKITFNTGAAYDKVMTFNNLGNLGIGTSPGSILDVQRNSVDDQMIRLINLSGIAKMRFVSSNNSEALHQWTSENGWIASIAAKYNATANSQYIKFRVVGGGNTNSEEGLAAATKLTILGSGNIGVGTESPTARLHVVSDQITTSAFNHSSFDGGINIQNTGTLASLRSSQLRLINGATTFGANDRTYQLANVATSSTAAKFTFQYFDGINYFERLTIFPSGNVGINTATPQESLHVTGNGRFTAVGAGTFGNNLNITSDGTLTTATSDEKYKYNILPISYGLNTILDLKPVNFQWIQGEENDLGFIAQDVADVIPEAVNTNWNSDLLMRYESIIPILTKAIQEQNAIIKALEQRIINLENK